VGQPSAPFARVPLSPALTPACYGKPRKPGPQHTVLRCSSAHRPYAACLCGRLSTKCALRSHSRRHTARQHGVASPQPHPEETAVTLCPIAIVASCKKCPAFAVCPLKSVIGDHKPTDEASKKQAPSSKADRKG
jgi:hypothetical protein